MAESVPLLLDKDQIHRPLRLINPTTADFHLMDPHARNASVATISSQAPIQPTSGIRYRWTSRNNRKGRHALVVGVVETASIQHDLPAFSNSLVEVHKGIWRMATYYPVWDVSWLVGVTFTFGSLVWITNALFLYLPCMIPWLMATRDFYYGAAITSFMASSIFQFGSIFLMLEALNANKSGCFGWALYKTVNEGENDTNVKLIAEPSYASCSHHHQYKRSLVGKPAKPGDSRNAEKASLEAALDDDESKAWTWWPSADEMRTHYLLDIGFIASTVDVIGSTIFWVSGFAALPGIFNRLTEAELYGLYWLPQAIGGCFYIIAGILWMIETQRYWWRPATSVLGWHIGFWTVVGGIGFTLSGFFGLDTADWAQYQAGLTTLWGALAFLIASVLQWYESLNKHPVERA